MTNNLYELLKKLKISKHATDAGRRIHSGMRHIIIDNDKTCGNPEIIAQIKSYPNLLEFFSANSMTEVPIAGFINDTIVSRRIDRMIINNDNKTIKILDYKTDTDKNIFLSKYIAQIQEYKILVQDIFPGYTVYGYILWLHDFSLTEIK